MDVVRRQPQLVEVRAERGGRDPVVAKVGHGRMPVPLRELLSILAEEQPVMDRSRELTAEGAGDPPLRLVVRAMVGAANDVR